jgi:hypothetical protein
MPKAKAPKIKAKIQKDDGIECIVTKKGAIACIRTGKNNADGSEICYKKGDIFKTNAIQAKLLEENDLVVARD